MNSMVTALGFVDRHVSIEASIRLAHPGLGTDGCHGAGPRRCSRTRTRCRGPTRPLRAPATRTTLAARVLWRRRHRRDLLAQLE